MSHEPFLRKLLGHPGPDPGCDACLALMDQYIEAELAGEDADARFPEMAAHLRDCVACRQDVDGLRSAVERDRG